MTWVFAITSGQEATLLGLAALITALGGLASVILALRKSRSEETEDCLRRLRDARAESEALAKELHELKMERADEGEPDLHDRGGGGVRGDGGAGDSSGGIGELGAAADEDGDDQPGAG